MDALLAEGYRWAVVPERPVRQDGERWSVGDEEWRVMDTSRTLGSTGTLARRVAFALQSEERLLETWSPVFLLRELERWFWSQEGVERISPKKLWEENLTRYVYFPRLRDRDVLVKAIQDGATSRDFFGYAVGCEGGKYVGLSFGQRPSTVLLDDASVIVRKDAGEAATPPTTAEPPRGPKPGPEPVPEPRAKVMRRFYGSVKLNELKVSSGAGQIAEEVVKHLVGLVDAEVEVILEVRAKAPSGIPDSVVRTVSENAKTLKFQTFEFEEE